MKLRLLVILLTVGALIAIAADAATITIGTITQRVRTYDTGATSPNDPRGFIACGSTIPSTVNLVYVDLTATGTGGNVIERIEHASLPTPGSEAWSHDTPGRLWGLGSSVGTYRQPLFASGDWTFRAWFGGALDQPPGAGPVCTIHKP